MTKNRVNGLMLLFLGFLACWFSAPFWSDAQGQVPFGQGPPAGYPMVNGRPQVDMPALIAGGQLVGVTRPLEVPPIYAFDMLLADQCQQVVIVDSETKRICVYHIRPKGNASTIEIVAARNFQWDLKLDDFNNERITPGQIREQIQRRETGKP